MARQSNVVLLEETPPAIHAADAPQQTVAAPELPGQHLRAGLATLRLALRSQRWRVELVAELHDDDLVVLLEDMARYTYEFLNRDNNSVGVRPESD